MSSRASRARARPAASCARARSGRRAAARAPRGARGSPRRRDEHVRRSAVKPEVTSHTCRSCTSLTPGMRGQRVADRVGVDARAARPPSSTRVAWPSRLESRADHQRCDEQRDDAVGALEPGGQHEQAGERRAERRVEVGEHVRARALDVERAALGARQRPRRADIDAGAREADDEHDARPRRRAGRPSRWTASIAITPASTSSAAPLTCAERISARPSPNVKRPAGGRAASRGGDQRERDRAGVGEHVRGVGEQRERVGEQARDDLDDHEARGSAPSAMREPAAVGVGRRRVRVRVTVVCRDGAGGRGRPPRRYLPRSSRETVALEPVADLVRRVRRPAPAPGRRRTR